MDGAGIVVASPGEHLAELAHLGLADQLAVAVADVDPDRDRARIEVAGRRDDRGIVAVVVDLAGRNLDFTEIDGLLTNQIRWLIWITDHDGTLVARDGGRADLRLTHERAALVRGLGTRLVSSFDLPSGRYRARIAAQASGGRAGSLFADLDVPEVDGTTLELSGVLLTSKSVGAVPALRRLADLPMPAMPTTRRTFSQDDILAFAAHIGVPATDPVTVTATLTGNGATVERRFENRYDAGPPGASNIYSKSLPLNGVPPGSYVLEVRARTTPSRLATVVRRVPLEITPARDVPTAREGSETRSSADLASLLESAGERIVEYEQELSDLVAEEQYLQESVSIGGLTSRVSAGRRVLPRSRNLTSRISRPGWTTSSGASSSHLPRSCAG